eukprot:gnl/TRDRNA2_/TRDRNA2_178183_c0_seq1.p2 gnl/TRDRNA2_/TRDRNA2_178183_c0~~gnl/TRDRNA2_/TRDRNA2_178183_c0_seq1.p2  ORF type:complete len:121 (-),score=28.12 gnl/TRDRNA2_/TRDRNA2_178183_c0_seq1:187-549(-)
MQFPFVVAALLLVASNAYPVFTPGAPEGSTDTCKGVKCKALECKPPFKYKSPGEMGTCCPLCWSDTVKVPEDAPKEPTTGIGMNNNADPILCRGVMCPPLHCPETEQTYEEGSCCTKCSR